MKLVIAGKYKQYQDYIRNNELNPREYKYCCRFQDIAGFHKTEIIYTGEYWLNPLYNTPDLQVIELRSK